MIEMLLYVNMSFEKESGGGGGRERGKEGGENNL